MVSCFLVETRKTILDHLIEMNDQHLTKQIGECRRVADERHRKYWKLTRTGQDLLVGSMEWMLEQEQPKEVWAVLLERTPAAELRNACVHYRESRRLEQTGYVGVLRERMQWQVRPYLKEFLQLPFQAEAGASGLKQALAAASIYYRDKRLLRILKRWQEARPTAEAPLRWTRTGNTDLPTVWWPRGRVQFAFFAPHSYTQTDSVAPSRKGSMQYKSHS
jgi:hypothetical protein